MKKNRTKKLPTFKTLRGAFRALENGKLPKNTAIGPPPVLSERESGDHAGMDAAEVLPPKGDEEMMTFNAVGLRETRNHENRTIVVDVDAELATGHRPARARR